MAYTLQHREQCQLKKVAYVLILNGRYLFLEEEDLIQGVKRVCQTNDLYVVWRCDGWRPVGHKQYVIYCFTQGTQVVFLRPTQFHSGHKHSNGENVNPPGPEAQLLGCQDCGATARKWVKHPGGWDFEFCLEHTETICLT